MAFKTGFAHLVLALGYVLTVSPAAARPPTVTTSPGYDRALAESRKALQQPPAADVKPAPRKRTKRTQPPH